MIHVDRVDDTWNVSVPGLEITPEIVDVIQKLFQNITDAQMAQMGQMVPELVMAEFVPRFEAYLKKEPRILQ